MKPEDLFEILSDIDEDMVDKANARRFEDIYTQPQQVVFAEKKFPWKAACAAMASIAVIAGVSAGAVWLAGSGSDLPFSQTLPSQQGGSWNGASGGIDYPEGADYVYKGDFSGLTLEKAGETDRKTYDIYDLMERDSDLVVYGSFTDDARQTLDLECMRDFLTPQDLHSYNKFRIDKIFKGDGTVKEGDEIVIAQDYVVFGEQLMTVSGLTPMIKGDKWFYCLTKSSDPDSRYYHATGDTDGRYCSDDDTNNAYTVSFDTAGFFDSKDYKQNIHKLVCERYLSDSIIPYTDNPINYLDGDPANELFKRTESFEMAEFSGVYFTWDAEKVNAVTGDKTITLYGGMPVYDLWLADLNGDGKREICSTTAFGSGMVDLRIMAYDYENGELYELSDRGSYDYVIDKINTLADSQFKTYYRKSVYNRDETVEINVLSVDVMQKMITKVLDGDDVDNTGFVMPPNAAENTGFVNSQEDESTVEESAETGENAFGSSVDPERFKIYEPFGMTWEGEKKGLYYNGKKVRWFEDYYPIDEDGNQAGIDYINETGEVDVYAVRDLSEPIQNPDGSFDPSGKLTGLKEFTEEEFNARDIKAILTDKEVTHIAYAYEDEVAVETNSDLVASVGDDETVMTSSDDLVSFAGEATTNQILTDYDMKKYKEERLRIAEEYKPFGVTYNEKSDQWYFNGEAVRYFRDILTSNGESLTGGKFSGSMRTMSGKGTVDIYTVRDFEKPDEDGIGKLIGIEVFGDGEHDPNADMIES